jgi:glycine betaine/proline transport system permease protein
LLFDVQIPLAMPTIMAGLNQTLMLALSMVVIVALIAGGGLGQEILRSVGRLDIARAASAGLAVLILAVVLDRISQVGTRSAS